MVVGGIEAETVAENSTIPQGSLVLQRYESMPQNPVLTAEAPILPEAKVPKSNQYACGSL